MSSNLISGYGLYLTDFELRGNAASRVCHVMSEKRITKLKHRWKKEAPHVPFNIFVEVDIEVNSYEEILSDIINENEFGGKSVIAGTAGGLYIPVSLPKTDRGRLQVPLEKDIRDVIAKYAGLCCKGVRKKDVRYQMFLPKL